MVEINQKFEATQREMVNGIAKLVFASHGWVLPDDPMYLYESQHSSEKLILAVSEQIFQMFYGDEPDYIDDAYENF